MYEHASSLLCDAQEFAEPQDRARSREEGQKQCVAQCLALKLLRDLLGCSVARRANWFWMGLGDVRLQGVAGMDLCQWRRHDPNGRGPKAVRGRTALRDIANA